jgi:hypothetical protein
MAADSNWLVLHPSVVIATRCMNFLNKILDDHLNPWQGCPMERMCPVLSGTWRNEEATADPV